MEETEELEVFLEHYGIPGMKWGRRKARTKRHEARTVFSRSPNSLSDAELKRRISRMEFEKRYNDLNRRDIKPGEELATKILKTSGLAAATAIGTAAAVYVGKMAIGNIFGIETMQDMFPKKKK